MARQPKSKALPIPSARARSLLTRAANPSIVPPLAEPYPRSDGCRGPPRLPGRTRLAAEDRPMTRKACSPTALALAGGVRPAAAGLLSAWLLLTLGCFHPEKTRAQA